MRNVKSNQNWHFEEKSLISYIARFYCQVPDLLITNVLVLTDKNEESFIQMRDEIVQIQAHIDWKSSPSSRVDNIPALQSELRVQSKQRLIGQSKYVKWLLLGLIEKLSAELVTFKKKLRQSPERETGSEKGTLNIRCWPHNLNATIRFTIYSTR